MALRSLVEAAAKNLYAMKRQVQIVLIITLESNHAHTKYIIHTSVIKIILKN